MQPCQRQLAALSFLITPVYSTAFSKRRKQIWEALHPEGVEKHVSESAINLEVGNLCLLQDAKKHGGSRSHRLSFAEATSEATGQAPRTTRLAIARADALGDEALTKSFQIALRWPESICWCNRANDSANRANDSVNRAYWGFATGCKTTPEPFLMKSAPGLMNALTQCLSRTASPPRLPSPPKIVLSVLTVTTQGFSQNRVDRASRAASPDLRKVSGA